MLVAVICVPAMASTDVSIKDNTYTVVDGEFTKTVTASSVKAREAVPAAVKSVADTQLSSVTISSSDKTNLDNADINIYTTIECVSPEETLFATTPIYKTTAYAQATQRTLSGSKWDSTYSVQAYGSIYYTFQGLVYDVDHVEGGWDVDDGSVNLSDRTVKFQGEKNPSRNSFSYSDYYHSSFEPSMKTSVTLKRQADKWTLKLTVN